MQCCFDDLTRARVFALPNQCHRKLDLGEECKSNRPSGGKGAGVLEPTSRAFPRSRCRLAL